MNLGVCVGIVRFARRTRLSVPIYIVVIIQVAFLATNATRLAPVYDEFGHFYSGLRYWQAGECNLYRVNPPFIRIIASLPAYISGFRAQAVSSGGVASEVVPKQQALQRPEFEEGRKLFCLNPRRFQLQLMLGRYIVSAFCVGTTVAIFLWARAISGPLGGIVAAGLWAFQPQVIAHGSLITSDVACGGLMLVSVWQLSHAVKELRADRSLLLGLLVGLAVLAKFTSLILVPVTLLAYLWLADKNSLSKICLHLLLVLLAMVIVICIPYKFEGLGIPLTKLMFASHAFEQLQMALAATSAWLPFCDSCFVTPVPREFLLGLDRQQFDFERGLPSYAFGKYQGHGWWWFYLYSCIVKMPLGSLLAVLVTMCLLMRRPSIYLPRLAIPCLVIVSLFIVTALKDGIGQQHRYILPAYPFVFLTVGVVCHRSLQTMDRRFAALLYIGLLFTVLRCVSTAPYWLPCFNVVAGGNHNGYKCLFNDATDWGQDTYVVRDWINQHQGGPTIYVKSSLSGAELIQATGAGQFCSIGRSISQLQTPCWLVISATDFVKDRRLFDELHSSTPVEMLGGGSHLVYFLRSTGG